MADQKTKTTTTSRPLTDTVQAVVPELSQVGGHRLIPIPGSNGMICTACGNKYAIPVLKNDSAPECSASSTQEQLPVFTAIGWARVPAKGYVVALIETQGDRVIRRELLTEAVVKAVAQEELSKAVVRKLFMPKDAKKGL